MRVSHEAAGIHCVYWNCRGLAARDARAAVNPRDWMAVRYVSRDRPTNARGISQGARRRGLRRGPERPDRISLGGRPLREAAGNGGRSGRTAPVAVIVTGGGDPAALAAKAATSTLPIVIVIGSDPVKEGLVPASIGPAATSPERPFFPTKWNPSGSACCTRRCPLPKPSLCCSIRPIRTWNAIARCARSGGGYWRRSGAV